MSNSWRSKWVLHSLQTQRIANGSLRGCIILTFLEGGPTNDELLQGTDVCGAETLDADALRNLLVPRDLCEDAWMRSGHSWLADSTFLFVLSSSSAALRPSELIDGGATFVMLITVWMFEISTAQERGQAETSAKEDVVAHDGAVIAFTHSVVVSKGVPSFAAALDDLLIDPGGNRGGNERSTTWSGSESFANLAIHLDWPPREDDVLPLVWLTWLLTWQFRSFVLDVVITVTVAVAVAAVAAVALVVAFKWAGVPPSTQLRVMQNSRWKSSKSRHSTVTGNSESPSSLRISKTSDARTIDDSAQSFSTNSLPCSCLAELLIQTTRVVVAPWCRMDLTATPEIFDCHWSMEVFNSACSEELNPFTTCEFWFGVLQIESTSNLKEAGHDAHITKDLLPSLSSGLKASALEGPIAASRWTHGRDLALTMKM
jgi:hypothetical protein